MKYLAQYVYPDVLGFFVYDGCEAGMNKVKYIRIAGQQYCEDGHKGGFVLFHETFVHREVGLGCVRPIAGGFCETGPEGLYVYGKSESLRRGPRLDCDEYIVKAEYNCYYALPWRVWIACSTNIPEEIVRQMFDIRGEAFYTGAITSFEDIDEKFIAVKEALMHEK